MYPIVKPYFTFLTILRLFNFFNYKQATISEFEEKFAKKIGRKYAIAFSSGRVALQHFFESQNIYNEDIIIPAYTCIVVPYAVELSSNRPIFVETKQGQFVPTFSELIMSKSKYIILTHMFGEVTPIFLEREKYFIIEDACLALGSQKGDQKAGQIGDVAFFSFNQSKQMSMYGGGILVTDSKIIYDALQKCKSNRISIKSEIKQVVKTIIYFFYFQKVIYSFAKKLTVLFKIHSKNFSTEKCTLDKSIATDFLVSQAILGLQQLQDLDYILNERKKIANYYYLYLKGLSCFRRPPKSDEGYELSHYWIILNGNRSEIMDELRNCYGINTGFANEYSCPTTSYYAFLEEAYPDSTFIGKNIINLPFYIGLTERDVQYISNSLKEVCEKYR